jgi:DNA-binding sugar fermentation-stimulating protein
VLGIAMIKEAIEDYKRYKQDVEVNNRRVEVRLQTQGGARGCAQRGKRARPPRSSSALLTLRR